LLVVVVIAVAAQQQHDDQRGLLSALNKRRAALAARISGIMRRSSREKNAEKDADGKTFNQDSDNNRGYYQYQLDGNTQVYDSFTYYDDENPEKQTPEGTDNVKNDALRDDGEGDEYDESYEAIQQTQQSTYEPSNYYQQNSQYTQGEYISNDSGDRNRRPFSSLLSRLTSLFGGRQFNIDAAKSIELTNLINEQIDIDNHVKYIQSTGQGRSNNVDESYSPLHLSRSKIGEGQSTGRQAQSTGRHAQSTGRQAQSTGRQAGGAGVFIPITYGPSKGHNNHYYNNYNPYYQTSKPQGWVVKPVQHVYYPSNGYYKPSYPIYFKPKDLEGTIVPHQVNFEPHQGTFLPHQETFGPQLQSTNDEYWTEAQRTQESDLSSSLKEKLESIENQVEYIKTHTDATAGNRPQILFDLGIQGHELKNKIKRIEYAVENNISPYYKK